MIRIFLVITALMALFFTSCAKEGSGEEGNGGGVVADGETEIDISFVTNAPTRASIAAESTISTVDVLVFDASGAAAEDDALFQYVRYAWLSTGTTYRATLKQDSDLNIYFAINARAVVDALTATAGVTTYAEVVEQLVLTSPGTLSVSSGLPMWGASNGVTISESNSIQSLGSIKLLRSVASADLSVTAQNFSLQSATVGYGANIGYLPYSVNNISVPDAAGYFHSVAPFVPAAMTTTVQWTQPVTAINEVQNVIYMYENDADESSASRTPTRVVLAGYYGTDNTTKITYYPLAFRDASTNDKLDVKRNSKYNIIVTNVNGEGYDTLGEALTGEEVNMTYEVIPWDDFEEGDIYIDGTHYISMPSRSATIGKEQGAEAYLIFTTNYELTDFSYRFDPDGSWVAYPNSVTSDSRFEANIMQDSEGNKYFHFISLLEYGTDDNPAVLYVRAGRILFTINVEQIRTTWDLGGDYDTQLG